MQILNNDRKAVLLLEDGALFEGLSFGAQGTTMGEVVFTTAMTGYQEALSDPAYEGQIVAQTFPLLGNYGVNGEDMESSKVHARGYVVREHCENPSNFRCEHTLDWFMCEHNIIGICNIDTRALTRHLREHGVMSGMITTKFAGDNKETLLAQLRAYQPQNAVEAVSVEQPVQFAGDSAKFDVAVLDFGCAKSTIEALRKHGCNVALLPCGTSAQEIKNGGYDGLVLSGGPGNPASNPRIISALRDVAQLGIPTFGIGLGHQMLALAHGAKVVKLGYGHRGGSQPVIDLETGKTCVTSQNHGYEVVSDSVPAQAGRVSFVNANGRGCEGINYADGKTMTVQFTPESGNRPSGTGYLFDRFVQIMEVQKGVQ